MLYQINGSIFLMLHRDAEFRFASFPPSIFLSKSLRIGNRKIFPISRKLGHEKDFQRHRYPVISAKGVYARIMRFLHILGDDEKLYVDQIANTLFRICA